MWCRVTPGTTLLVWSGEVKSNSWEARGTWYNTFFIRCPSVGINWCTIFRVGQLNLVGGVSYKNTNWLDFKWGISSIANVIWSIRQHATLSVDVIWSPWWNRRGATITIICGCHLSITAEYVSYQWRVGTSYELIGLACVLGWDELAFLLGWNHLNFKVQSIHWLY